MAGANGLEPPSSATSVATPGRLTGRASARSSSSKRSRPRVTERRYRGSGSANAPAALLAGAALRSLHLVQLATVERLTVEKQAPHGFVSRRRPVVQAIERSPTTSPCSTLIFITSSSAGVQARSIVSRRPALRFSQLTAFIMGGGLYVRRPAQPSTFHQKRVSRRGDDHTACSHQRHSRNAKRRTHKSRGGARRPPSVSQLKPASGRVLAARKDEALICR